MPIVAGADEFTSVYQSNAAIQGRTEMDTTKPRLGPG